MTEAEIGWAAGLFEGEGSIVITGEYTVRLVLGMTDKDVVERLNQLFPCKNLRTRDPSQPHHKPQYIWQIGRPEEVKEILTLFMPWLGERRSARAKEALQALEGHPGPRGTFNRAKTHCPKGHPYTEENTYINNGRRSCKECLKESVYKYRTENREQYLLKLRERAKRNYDPEKRRQRTLREKAAREAATQS